MELLHNLRLVAATTLLGAWGFAHLSATPVLGESPAALVLALVVAPGGLWSRGRRAGTPALLVVLGAMAALTALLYWLGSEGGLQAFTHSPWFVLPVWGLGLFGLVRNAAHAARTGQAERAIRDAPSAGRAPAAPPGRR